MFPIRLYAGQRRIAARNITTQGCRMSMMERFVHRQNLERYRRLLTQVTDEAQREQILKLIAEEETKDKPPSKQT